MRTQRFWPCKTRYLVGPLSLFLCDGSTDSQIPDMQSAQEDLQKNNQELNDMCRDKTNKLTQMTNLYNLLKSRAMRSRMQTAASDTVSNSVIAECLSIPLASRSPLAPASISRFAKTPTLPRQHGWSSNSSHRHQRSGTSSSKRAKTKTPSEASILTPYSPQIGWPKQYVLNTMIRISPTNLYLCS